MPNTYSERAAAFLRAEKRAEARHDRWLRLEALRQARRKVPVGLKAKKARKRAKQKNGVVAPK